MTHTGKDSEVRGDVRVIQGTAEFVKKSLGKRGWEIIPVTAIPTYRSLCPGHLTTYEQISLGERLEEVADAEVNETPVRFDVSPIAP